MSSKTMLATVAAVFVGATIMITGQSFAASTPAAEPTSTRAATGVSPRPTPATEATAAPARAAEPVRTRARFTG